MMKNGVSRVAERLLLTAGLALLVAVAAALVYRSTSSHTALKEFDQSQKAWTQQKPPAAALTFSDGEVDVSLWSPKRVREYKESLLIKKDAPMGVLRLERLRIRVPIFEGTDELVLDRGAGWIAGTARPGAAGDSNIGIAGHRDGFFRGLKDIAIRDKIQVSTLGVESFYAVDSTELVTPEQVEVLRRRGVPSLTLVTCYPFYFIGDAPQRFIVHATLQQQVEAGKLHGGSSTL
jgi:sortase A